MHGFTFRTFVKEKCESMSMDKRAYKNDDIQKMFKV